MNDLEQLIKKTEQLRQILNNKTESKHLQDIVETLLLTLKEWTIRRG